MGVGTSEGQSEQLAQHSDTQWDATFGKRVEGSDCPWGRAYRVPSHVRVQAMLHALLVAPARVGSVGTDT